MRVPAAAGVCLVVLAGVVGPTATPDTPGDRAAATRAQLDALRSRIERVKQKITSGSDQRQDLAAALDAAQARVVRAQERLDALDERIAQDRRQIGKLAATIETQRARLGDRIGQLRRQVRAAYRQGRVNRTRLLLSGASPARIGRLLVYYQYFTAAQKRRIDRLKAALTELGQRRQALQKRRRQLAERREQRAETLARVRASEQTQRQTIAALDRRLAARQNDLTAMRDNEKKLRGLLDALEKQMRGLYAAGETAFAKLKGRLQPPVKGRVLASYHQARRDGTLRWQGRWLAAPQGAPVRAVAPGRVVYVGYMKRYGLIIIVDHGKRYYTLFGHVASAFCRVGEAVAAGDQIATAGTSGGHTQSGVFFQIRRGSRALDPADWLAG